MKQSRRFKKRWLLLCFVCVGVVIFHQPLLLLGCKVALRQMLPNTEGREVSYEKIEWEGGVIALSGLAIKDLNSELTVDRIELQFAGDFFRAHFAPVITLVHPQMIVKKSDGHPSSALAFLYRSRFFEPRWEVKNGVLELLSSRLYFSMSSAEARESIGVLSLSHDPDPWVAPMLSAEIRAAEQKLQIGFKLQMSDLNQLLPLTTLVFSDLPREWEKVSGDVELEGSIFLNKGFGLEELHLRGTGHGITLASSKMGIALECGEMEGSFSFPAFEGAGFFWDRFAASLTVDGAECALGALGIKNLSGRLVFEPQKEPELFTHGLLLQGGQEMAFDLLGKGGVHEDSTFWSEMEFTLGGGMHALCSLSKYEEGALGLHVTVEEVGFEHLDLMRALSGSPGECVEGTASGEATLLYKGGRWHSLSVEKCLLDRVRWYFPQQGATVFSERIEGECMLASSELSQWALEDLHLKVQGGDYLDSDLYLHSLSCDLNAHQGAFISSEFQGQWEGLRAKLAILGPEGDHFADLTVDGEIADRPAALQIAAKLNQGALSLEGSGSIAEEPFRGNALFLMTPKTLPDCLAGNWPTFQLKEGNFSAEYLTQKSYGVFFPGSLIFEKVEGDFVWEGKTLKVPSFYAICEGLACRGHLDAQFAEEGGGWINLSTSQVAGEAQSFLSLVKKLPSFPAFAIPISGDFSSGEKGMLLRAPFGLQEGEVEWSFAGSFDHLSFPINPSTKIKEGYCDVAIDSKEKLLTIENGEGIWELKDGMLLTVQLKRCLTRLDQAGTLDFALKVVQGKKEFAHFEALATGSADSRWDVAFNTQTTHFAGTPLNIQRCQFHEKTGVILFDMSPLLRCQDLHAHVSLLQNAGFFPETLSVKNLQEWGLEGTAQTQILSENIGRGFSFQAKSHDLKIKGTPLEPFYVRGQKTQEKWLIEQLEAGPLHLTAALVTDAEGFAIPRFEGNWEGLLLKGSGFVKTEKKQFSCTLESIKGDLSFLSKAPFKGTFVASGACTGDFSDLGKDLELSGEANGCIDLQSPLPILATSSRTVKFNYQKEKGISCKGFDLSCKHKFSGAHLARIEAEKLFQSPSRNFSIEHLEFSLTPALVGFAIDAQIVPAYFQRLHWEGNLEGSGDFQIAENGLSFQGNLRPGRYGFEEKIFPFEQVQLRYEKELFSLRAKAQIEEEPLWASLQVDLAKEPYGMLKLFDHPKAEGLKILFSTQNGQPVLESVQGSCYGLTCSLAKNGRQKNSLATVLSGEIKVDGNLLLDLFPKNIREGIKPLKIGSGYAWQGDLALWQGEKKGFSATGILKGREFEILGYRLQKLEAAVEATPEHFLLSGLKIEDASGQIGIKTIELKKAKDWDLRIPQIVVRSLYPSLMQKIGSEPQELKPFMIKSFTLTDIFCHLGDKASLHGSGHLMFVNQFKKEASIFDAPLEILKKLGLDLALLTPVQGEIQMELRGDKFYLVSLDNSFSEGERAEFYLSPEKNISFIDLDGKMHIDLKMRQDVVLKITEPLTLTIRGTLDKPRYGLQF